MSLSALKFAEDTLSAAPVPPTFASPAELRREGGSGDIGERGRALAERAHGYEGRAETWQRQLDQAEQQLQITLTEEAREWSDKDRDAALASLERLASAVDGHLSLEKTRIAEMERALVARLGGDLELPAEVARFLQEHAERVLQSLRRQHDRAVEFYYFLLALHAEYDRDARGGPTFSDPAELASYMRQQLKV
jgi:hypothetical protein